MPVIETLYKTNAPEQLERAEYFQPRIEQKYRSGRCVFVVTEKHGWYDDQGKEVIDPRSTLDPRADEGFDSLEEAQSRYDEHVRRRASEGYFHSFYIEFDIDTMGPVYKYRLLS